MQIVKIHKGESCTNYAISEAIENAIKLFSTTTTRARRGFRKLMREMIPDGRYPVQLKGFLTGEEVDHNGKDVHLYISKKVVDDKELLSEFVVYVLKQEALINKKIRKCNSIPDCCSKKMIRQLEEYRMILEDICNVASDNDRKNIASFKV